MTLWDWILRIVITLAHVTALLIIAGAVAHLTWYAMSFGWGLVG